MGGRGASVKRKNGGGRGASAKRKNGGGSGGGQNNENVVAGSGTAVTVNVRFSNGSKFSEQVGLESTVRSFKSVLAQKYKIPVEQQRLIHKGKILKDNQTLQSYALEADHTVHLVGRFPPPDSPNAAVVIGNVFSNASPNPTTNAGSTEVGPFGEPRFGTTLFSGLACGSAGGLFGSGLSELEQVQQPLTQNPNMIREFFNMPFVQQNLMKKPEKLRNDPQMREIMDRNPEFAHVLNDPATLRRTMEAARNPELMREMMHNTERAMSNIESSPEGLNMLRRMYENVQEPVLNATTMAGESVQEPFLNATTMAGENMNGLGSNPFTALLGTQGGAPGRYQSTNPITITPQTIEIPPPPFSIPTWVFTNLRNRRPLIWASTNTIPFPDTWASTNRRNRQLLI